MQCQNCHSELPEGARFCSECGTSIAPAPQAVPTPSEVFQSSPFDQEQGASHAASEPTEAFQTPSSYQEYVAPAMYQEYAGLPQNAQAPLAATAYASMPGTPAPGTPYAGYPAPGFPPNANNPYATQSAYTPYFAGAAPTQPRRRNKTVLIVTLVTVIALVVLLGGGITYFVTQSNQRNQAVQALQWDDPNSLYSGVQALSPTTTSALDSASGSPWKESAPLSDSHPFACAFKDGSYHVTTTQLKYIYTCIEKTSYSDFAMQVDVSILQGEGAGFSFRHPGTGDYYTFLYTTQGTYTAEIYSGGEYKRSLLSGSRSQDLKTGVEQTNTVMIIAHKSTFDIYANGKFVDTFSDSTYTEGTLGLTAYAKSSPAEVSFSNLKIWRL
ncbi:zinc-ribbon domain-containing protein [Ktedonobacter racemifer]|uniref:Zinc-ribbon domain-containing protein n=1 Tax=Ktedonobacter racemifer DSM 44963 TaxID=485913 RepID=D6TTS4_KTERA|nr:family 16 glycoside hydrolase [Ktedonobacter racemifer]EFH83825.1 hypothetical protein Krac_4825 [Ktedonobacter racemifer DSM 44963]